MPANRAAQLGHAQRRAAVGGVDVEPPAARRRTRRRRRRARRRRRCWSPRRWRRRRTPVVRRRRGERRAGEPVALVAGDLDDVEVEQGGGAAHRRVGRRRAGDGEATGAGCAAAPLVAGDGEPAEVAGRAAGHEAAGRARRQAGERAQPVEGGVLGGDGGAGLLPALAGERPRADDGVEQRRRRRRRRRDVGEERAVVEGDVVRQQDVVDEPQRRVDADAVGRDGGQRGDVVPAPACARAGLRVEVAAIRRPSSPTSWSCSADQPWSCTCVRPAGHAGRRRAGSRRPACRPASPARSPWLAVSDCSASPPGRRTWTCVVDADVHDPLDHRRQAVRAGRLAGSDAHPLGADDQLDRTGRAVAGGVEGELAEAHPRRPPRPASPAAARRLATPRKSAT